MEDKIVIKNLKYEFSEAEDRQNAKELARQNQALVEAELKKKQVTADLKAEAENIAARIGKLSRWVNDGYDFREIQCKIVFNDPKNGTKSLYRTDTGELVESMQMEEWEKQSRLPLEIKDEEGTVTISAPGMYPVTMTDQQFSEAARRIGEKFSE